MKVRRGRAGVRSSWCLWLHVGLLRCPPSPLLCPGWGVLSVGEGGRVPGESSREGFVSVGGARPHIYDYLYSARRGANACCVAMYIVHVGVVNTLCV